MSAAYEVDMKAEASGRIRRLGLGTTLAAFPRMVGVLFQYPGSRSIMSSALSVPKAAFEYVGYGVYAGRNTG